MPMQVRFTNAPRLQVRVVALPGNVIDVFGRVGHVVAQFGDYTAALVSNTPSGSITATTVQAAINQLASGGGVSPAALTKTDDTNITATLGGTPTTALLQATSITLGWTGTLAVSRGGIGTTSWAGTNSLVASGASGTGAIQIIANGATTGTVLLSNGVGALPGFGVLAPIGGGTGTGTWATNTIILGGTTATGTFQQVASGASGTVLTSQGAGVLPVYASAGGVSVLTGTDSRLQNVGFTLSVTSSSLTITLTGANGSAPAIGNEVVMDFRSPTGTIATSSSLTLTSSFSLTISSGSTLGVISSTAFRLWIAGFNDAGTFRLGVINCSTASAGATQIFPLNEDIASSTAEGGAGAADSAGVIYTGTAVTAKAMRILGYAEWSAAGLSAGTWTVTNLIRTQVFGPGIRKPGDIIQTVLTSTTSGAATTNTTATIALSASITPTSGANLIGLEAFGKLSSAASLADGRIMLKNGTTALVSALLFNGNAGIINTAAGLSYMEKPNSASAQTYNATVQADGTRSAGWGNNGDGTTSLSMIVKEFMG